MAPASWPSDKSSLPHGGGFLLDELRTGVLLTPEGLSDEQRQIAATSERFVSEEVVPAIEELEKQKPGLARDLMRKAGDLGLLAVFVPESYGGLEMELTSALVVAERMGRYPSFSTTFGAHADIGTRPLVFFGTEEQKRRYLPRLASGEWLAAYCLSEPQAGSDALAARSRATLSADGRHWVLNGEKMWISNGGWADFYTVFAKVDGEKFTAFLVERSYPGVKPGAEERKMGLKGSSTTPLVLQDAQVPVGNVLGEVGRGHVIAFNILNLGRLELAASCVGGSKDVLAETIRYVQQRHAFGKPIAEFGLTQHKLAAMAARLYATESLVYRTSGLIDERMGAADWAAADGPRKALSAVEEYAGECSIAKVHASETLDFIVDEGVQLHGGYGFHQGYMVERHYRDSRVNRIFEGTNEINRLLLVSMLLKRAAQGRLPLVQAVSTAQKRGGPAAVEGDGPLAVEARLLANARYVAQTVLGLAYERFGGKLDEEQELVAWLADAVIALYAAESALLRAAKLGVKGSREQATDVTRLVVRDALREIDRLAVEALAACVEEADLAKHLAWLRSLTNPAMSNLVPLRRQVARRLLGAGRYVV